MVMYVLGQGSDGSRARLLELAFLPSMNNRPWTAIKHPKIFSGHLLSSSVICLMAWRLPAVSTADAVLRPFTVSASPSFPAVFFFVHLPFLMGVRALAGELEEADVDPLPMLVVERLARSDWSVELRDLDQNGYRLAVLLVCVLECDPKVTPQ